MNRTLKRHQIQNFFKMKNIISNGLFIVLVCTISMRLCQATTSDDDYDDYSVEDYYDYEDSSTQKSVDDENKTENGFVEETEATHISASSHNVTDDEEISSVAAVNGEDKTESLFGVLISDSDVSEDSNCPRLCTCDEQYQFIDCSNRSLTEIPKKLPSTTLHINLAHNYIKDVQENDLSNLTVVRQIILKNNTIQQIKQNIFRSLYRLDDLDLSSNNISEIDPDVFLYAQGLSSLTLDNNPISFRANHSFLNLPDLTILNLVGCNINKFYDQTFTNLSGLLDLNLANNSLAEDINVVAFYPLVSLLKLKLPHVSRNDTYELCDKIQAIDVISFDMYNISCYELVSGSTYDESTITHAPPTVHPKTTTTPMPTTSSTQVSIEEVTEITTSSSKQRAPQTTEKSVSPNSQGSQQSITKTNALNTTSDEDVKSKELEKSTQSMKTILIASIVIAVIGLAIGLVCRKDVFGVKTKLCRTQRPEPPTIPEQVPLNKV